MDGRLRGAETEEATHEVRELRLGLLLDRVSEHPADEPHGSQRAGHDVGREEEGDLGAEAGGLVRGVLRGRHRAAGIEVLVALALEHAELLGEGLLECRPGQGLHEVPFLVRREHPLRWCCHRPRLLHVECAW